MSIINSISTPIYRCIEKGKSYYHFYLWEKNVKKKLNNFDTKRESRHEIRSFYARYHWLTQTSHKWYEAATGVHDVRYMSDPLYYTFIDPYFNDWKAAKYLDHKCLYKTLFLNVRQPKIVAYRINGYWFDKTDSVIGIQQVVDLVRKEDTCFIKLATCSIGGKGVFFVNNSTSEGDILQLIDRPRNCDMIIQYGLKQSATLSKINESSVNTIRIITLLRNDGTVKIYSAILRMGINGAKVDNASSGGITVGINNDGSLKSVAYNACGERFDKHPSSHVHFDDYTIPNYDKVRELVLKQALVLPMFRLVSWDIALDELDEPVLIEANLCNGELDFHQLNNGPLFGDDTDAILEEVFAKRK